MTVNQQFVAQSNYIPSTYVPPQSKEYMPPPDKSYMPPPGAPYMPPPGAPYMPPQGAPYMPPPNAPYMPAYIPQNLPPVDEILTGPVSSYNQSPLATCLDERGVVKWGLSFFILC
jgi:hypothetical protein